MCVVGVSSLLEEKLWKSSWHLIVCLCHIFSLYIDQKKAVISIRGCVCYATCHAFSFILSRKEGDRTVGEVMSGEEKAVCV